MAISLWFVLVVLALVARIARNRTLASEWRLTGRKTPSDQLTPLPRYYPLVDARVYS